MTLQSSGAISLLDLQNEYGGSSPISLSEYYRGGSFVQSGFYLKGSFVALNTGVPTSGTISLSNFYGQGNL